MRKKREKSPAKNTGQRDDAPMHRNFALGETARATSIFWPAEAGNTARASGRREEKGNLRASEGIAMQPSVGLAFSPSVISKLKTMPRD